MLEKGRFLSVAEFKHIQRGRAKECVSSSGGWEIDRSNDRKETRRLVALRVREVRGCWWRTRGLCLIVDDSEPQ